MSPEGFKFSLENKECRTCKLNMIFDLTNSFKTNYVNKKEKTQIQNVLESNLVAGARFNSLLTKNWARLEVANKENPMQPNTMF